MYVLFECLSSLILRLILYEKWEENLLDLILYTHDVKCVVVCNFDVQIILEEG